MPFMKMELTPQGMVPTGIISDSNPEKIGEVWFNFVESSDNYDPTCQTRTYIVAGMSVIEKIVTDEAKVYAAQRKAAYPSIEEQLDTLYHKGVAGWKASITKIKTEFPKPDDSTPVEETPAV